MDLEKRYLTQDGIRCNILQLVKIEPEWAANRIQAGEKAEATLAEKEKELTELRGKVLKLAGALKDCMSYIDVDNLTMQANYRDWENALRAAVGR